MAEEAKAKGNAAFSSGDFTSAITHFFDTISLAPTNHVLYSNQSAAHASLHKYVETLTDAKKTVDPKPDWSKGYSCLEAAHIDLSHFDEVIFAYKKGLEIDPNNEALNSGLVDAQSSSSRSCSTLQPTNLFGDSFSGPEMWAKPTADPTTQPYLC